MKEAFLHYLWKFRKFEGASSKDKLFTSANSILQILKPGLHNQLAGPDFFNAQVRIDGQLWAGNVEIHIKSSDWYVHNHENDPTYDNVILHVVWEEDCSVYDKSNLAIPTLVLKPLVSSSLINTYSQLLESKSFKFINCETDFDKVPESIFENWIERVYFERLERKVLEIENQLEESQGDWEAVLFARLARNFGTVINADCFEELAKTISFTTIRKLATQKGQLEAVFLGISGLLTAENVDETMHVWDKDFQFNRNKFDLPQVLNHHTQFFKLRPPNFPTIRLSQLAGLYEKSPNIFEEIIKIKDRKMLHELFSITTSAYWETHYNFGKVHARKRKGTTAAFIDLLLINTVIPIKFAFAKAKGAYSELELIELLTQIPIEKNSAVAGYQKLRSVKNHALHSQSLLQLKSAYCDPNKCLQCQIGNYLLTTT